MSLDKVKEELHTEAPAVESAEETQEVSIDQAKSLFAARDSMKTIHNLKNELYDRRRVMVSDDETADEIEKRIAALSPDEIRALSDEAITEIFNFDGERIFELEFENEAQSIDFQRDFLAFMKESQMIHDQIDAQTAVLEEEMAKGKVEMDKIVAEFGDISNFMRAKLVEEVEAAEGDRKERVTNMLAAFDDAGKLDRVVRHYESIGTANTLGDYHTRAESVYERYMKVIKELNVKTDLTNFSNLEVKFLDAQYHKYPNLFLFAVIKQFAYKKGNVDPSVDGVFLSQMSVNIQALYAGTFATEEKKETFLAGIRKTLDLFY